MIKVEDFKVETVGTKEKIVIDFMSICRDEFLSAIAYVLEGDKLL